MQSRLTSGGLQNTLDSFWWGFLQISSIKTASFDKKVLELLIDSVFGCLILGVFKDSFFNSSNFVLQKFGEVSLNYFPTYIETTYCFFIKISFSLGLELNIGSFETFFCNFYFSLTCSGVIYSSYTLPKFPTPARDVLWLGKTFRFILNECYGLLSEEYYFLGSTSYESLEPSVLIVPFLFGLFGLIRILVDDLLRVKLRFVFLFFGACFNFFISFLFCDLNKSIVRWNLSSKRLLDMSLQPFCPMLW